MRNPDYYISPEEYELAAANGVNALNLEARIRKLHWSHRRAINTPIKERKDHSKWYPIAKKNGISYDTFTSRISRHWTSERAATEPVLSRHECGLRAGNVSKNFSREVLDLLKESKISYPTFYSRVKSGWDEIEAATSPIITKAEAGRRSVAKAKAKKEAKLNGVIS